ncbi:ExeA family protein [Marinobacterium lacunae]|nr:ExeA family protein [Marinobacterium lacunae]
MYCDYFGLRESPFSIAPNPRYLFMSEQHQEALAHLLYGITIDGGFVLLTGEVGTGKTTVARQLLEQLPSDTDVAVILNPKQSVVELLQSICDELNVPSCEIPSVKSLVDRIQQELLRRYAEGRNTVLLIDEAQQLSVDLLEQIRLLTNLETSEHKLLNIILLGQPELLELLARAELRQLSQRITARYHLGPLTLKELPLYIRHRLSVAGMSRPVFPEPVLKQLYRLSGGLPRLINLIGDRALLGTYVQKQNEVSLQTLKQAAREVFGEDIPDPISSRMSKRMILTAAVLVGLLAWGTGLMLSMLYKGELGGRWFEQVSGWLDMPAEASSKELTAIEQITKPVSVSAERGEHLKAESMPSSANALPVVESTVLASVTRSPVPLLQDSSAAGGVSQDNKAVKDASDMALWPTDPDPDLLLVLAYRRLFKAWQIDYDPRQQPVVCDFAEVNGLACLSLDGGADLLKQLDRPAVAGFTHKGQHYELLVLSLDAMRAWVFLDGREFSLPRSDLDGGWEGRFTLLWRPPPDYSAPIWPGASGDSVDWLEQHLARAEGKVVTGTGRARYNTAMVEQVRSFQRSKGLNVDGVVGPRTVIMLNSVTQDDLPRLDEPGS